MQEKINQTKGLVQIAILELITLFMFMLIGVSPIIAITSVFLLPIPIAIIYIKSNFNVTMIMLIINTILVFISTKNIACGVIALITCGGLGITLGICIKRRKNGTVSIFFLIGMTILITIINIFIILVFIEKKSIMTVINEIINYLNVFKDNTKEMYKNEFNFTDEQLKLVDSIMDPKEIVKAIPGIMIVTNITSAFLNYIISAKILQKMNFRVNKLKPFTQFYVSNLLGAVLIIITCIGAMLFSRNIIIGEYIYKTTIIMLEFLFTLNGVAFITYIIRNKYKISKTGTILIVLFSILIFQRIYLIAGFVEMLLDFRKLDPKRIFKKS